MKLRNRIVFLVFTMMFFLLACQPVRPDTSETTEKSFVETSASGECGNYNFTMHADGNIAVTSGTHCVDNQFAWFTASTGNFGLFNVYVGHDQNGNLGADVAFTALPDGATCTGDKSQATCTYTHEETGLKIHFDLQAVPK